ncbi:MAG TPA: TonB-dependent receptor [Candidatus Acidoferrales bacterium]|nr:TonB-dependent receptor [Candidatus Acidoferrales bacterium]
MQLHRFLSGAVWLFFASGLCVMPARGQQPQPPDLSGMSLEELANLKVETVYGASKFLQKAADVPSSVTVVTAEGIHKYGYRTLADILRSVPGFYVIYDRNYTYVGVRGLSRPGDYNARILFLLDGHRLNDNIFDGVLVGTEFPVDMGLIERIEIVRGPSSSVYGAGAFIAVINVVTKRGRDLNSLELSSAAGSWSSYKERVSYGKRFDSGLETLFSGTLYNSEGHGSLFFPEFNSPATNNGFAMNADGDQAYSTFADIIYKDFDIHFVQASRTKQIPTASFGTVFNDPSTQTTDALAYVDAQYRHVFGSWETLARVSYDWYGYNGTYIYDYTNKGVPPYTVNKDVANGDWVDMQWDASHLFFKRHDVTFGSEYRQDLRQHQANYDVQPFVSYLDDHRSARSWGLYMQDEFRLHRMLALVGGLRSDWDQKSGNTLSPRLGLIFNPTSTTSIKASYSRAFRAPNSYENFYADSTGAAGNPSLQPETIRSYELDLDHQFGKRFQGSIAGYDNRIFGLIEQQINPGTGKPVYGNSGNIRTKGIELEWSAKWPAGVEWAISHSIQSSRDLLTGDVLTNSPKQLAKTNLSVPFARQMVFANLEAQYTGERRTIAGTELGGFLLVNATLLTGRLNKNFDLSFSLYNLLNKQYAESGGIEHVETSIPQDGRSFRVKFVYRRHAADR